MSFKFLFLLAILAFSNVFAQKKELEDARNYVESSLNDSTLHNVVKKKSSTSLIDKKSAVSIAEIVLFQVYGKEKIINQRPYKTYQINNFWLIEGTLSKGKIGGVFQIIIDDRTAEIKRLTHGK